MKLDRKKCSLLSPIYARIALSAHMTPKPQCLATT